MNPKRFSCAELKILGNGADIVLGSEGSLFTLPGLRAAVLFGLA